MHRLFQNLWVRIVSLLIFTATLTGAATTTLPELTNAWEQAHLHIVDKDTNSVFINANERFLNTLRPAVLSLEDLIGKNDLDFYPTVLAEAYRADDRRVLSNGVPFEVVERYQPEDGPAFFVLTTKTPLRDVNGLIYALRIVFYTVPEPGQTTLPEFTSDWLRANALSIDKDTNSVFLNANENFLATLRPSFPHIKTVTNLIGRDDYYFYPPDLAEKFQTDDRQVMTRGVAFETIEDNQPIGSPRTSFQVAKHPLRKPDGTVYGLRILAWQIPQLHSKRLQGGLELSFAQLSAGFTLERSLELGETAVWEQMTLVPSNNVPTSLPAGQGREFFRLNHTEPATVTEWKPSGPITMVVPFGVGGSSDQLARLFATVLEPKLGQKVFVVNLPGNSGATGTESVLTSPRDGHTWITGSAADIGLYKITGLLNTEIKDWNCFLPVQYSQIYSVGAQSPHQNFGQLLEAFKAKPGVLRVGTAGPVTTGAIAMHLLQQKTGIQFSNLVFNSGAAVAAACAAGEIDVMAQSFTDGAALMRAGEIRPLATLSAEPLVVEGLTAAIPPVSQWVPGLSASGNCFGFLLPGGTPTNVVSAVEKIWSEVIPNSPELLNYAAMNGAKFKPVTGAAAQAEVLNYLSPVAWSLFEAGVTLFSPDLVGIPRP